jgi:hypothetical protein
MNPARNPRILLTLLAIVAVSALAGGFAGARLERDRIRHHFNPETWNDYAMRLLEDRLHLADDQRGRIQAAIDRAVLDMKGVHRETVQRTVDIVKRMLGEIDRELTPEQRKIAETLAPREEQLTIDLLKVKPK